MRGFKNVCFLLVTCVVVAASLDAADTVDVRQLVPKVGVRLKKEVPGTTFFVGKVESAAAADLSFQNDGKIVYIAPIGTSAYSLVCSPDNKTLIKGGVLAKQETDLFEQEVKAEKAAVLGAEASRDEAIARWDRCNRLLAKKIVSAKECEQNKRDYIKAEAAVNAAKTALYSAQYKLDACTLRAPFTGEVTDIYAADGTWVGKGDKILRFELLAVMLVTVDLPELLVQKVDFDDQFKIYPVNKEKAVGGWIYEESVRRKNVVLMVKNWKAPMTAIPDEYKDLPKVRKVFFVSKMFYHDTFVFKKFLPNIEKKVLLWVPFKSVKKDKDGYYVWRVKGAKKFSAYQPVARTFDLERVKVKPSNLCKDVPIGRFCALEDAGDLKFYDVIAVEVEGRLKNNDKAVLAVERWVFNPGEEVRVEIPHLTPKGFYVSQDAVFKDTSDRHYVYILDGDRIQTTSVKIVGGKIGDYCIEGEELKEGTVVFVKGVAGTRGGVMAGKYEIEE